MTNLLFSSLSGTAGTETSNGEHAFTTHVQWPMTPGHSNVIPLLVALCSSFPAHAVKLEDEMAKRLTMDELAHRRDVAALFAAAESTLESAKVADREKSGCLVTQSGRIIRKRKVAGQYVSQARNIDHGVSVTHRPLVQVKPAAEVRAWDAMVAADRVLVAAGCRSALVKVVKKDQPVNTPFEQLRAMVAGSATE